VLPPLLTDPVRWRRVAVDRYGVSVLLMDDSLTLFSTGDPVEGAAWLWTGAKDAKEVNSFAWSRPDVDHVALQGTFRGMALEVQLKRMDMSRFRLPNQSFQWIPGH
jgi:hypothetical protein